MGVKKPNGKWIDQHPPFEIYTVKMGAVQNAFICTENKGEYMDFFKKKIVKLVAWVLLACCSVVLIMGGANVEQISGGVVLVAGIVTAVSALVAFIAEKLKE